MSENEKEQVCAVCNVVTKKMCKGCQKVYYCDREHQKSDWKRHSKDCTVFGIIENEKFGRHNVATRNIEIDEIVICEKKPLFVTPDLGSGPLCLNCYAPLRLKFSKPCKNCGWPLCRNCTKHGSECELTIKYRKKKIIINDNNCPFRIYDTICALRAIAMRENSPDDYKKVLSLEDHGDKIPMSINNFTARSIIDLIGMDDVEEANIVKIMGIVRINCFGISSPEDHHYGALFEKASYNAHSCHPNCYGDAYYDVNTGARFVIRAIRKIPKGEPITISYVNVLWGTARRRHTLRATKMFECTCERCSDPTEYGTMFNAVKCCKKECTGYKLPPTFIVSNDEQVPSYVCNKCNAATPSTVIDDMIEGISTNFDEINDNNEKELKKFIKIHSEILHENHFHIINAEIKLSIALNQRNNNPKLQSEKFFRENIALCKKLDSLLQIIAPGENVTRAIILLSQYKSMNALSNLKKTSESITLFKDSKKAINEVYRLTRHEPKDQKEGEIAEYARSQLEHMNVIEKSLP